VRACAAGVNLRAPERCAVGPLLRQLGDSKTRRFCVCGWARNPFKGPPLQRAFSRASCGALCALLRQPTYNVSWYACALSCVPITTGGCARNRTCVGAGVSVSLCLRRCACVCVCVCLFALVCVCLQSCFCGPCALHSIASG